MVSEKYRFKNVAISGRFCREDSNLGPSKNSSHLYTGYGPDRTYWYYGLGARTNMRASLGKDPSNYQLADRNWPAVRNESFGKPWAPYCFNTNFVGGPPGRR